MFFLSTKHIPVGQSEQRYFLIPIFQRQRCCDSGSFEEPQQELAGGLLAKWLLPLQYSFLGHCDAVFMPPPLLCKLVIIVVHCC